MLNPDVELRNLRMRLERRAGIPEDFVDSIIDAATEDINNHILDTVASIMTEAVEHAESIGAYEFADDIDVIEHGGIYQISTRSGRTDYSTPERQMRDSLLKNVKTAKDGSQYRVIPIGGKSSDKGSGSGVTSIFQDQIARQGMITAARESIQAELSTARSNRTGAMTDTFRKMLAQHRTTRAGFNAGKSSRSSTSSAGSSAPTMRTVTSKQDPTENWVIPAKAMDMSEFLRDMNSVLADHIVKAVTTIVQGYERMD